MSSTVAGNKLAQEIHEEFLTCKICLEGFKTPKSLDCLHTFCEECIENHVLTENSYKKYSDYREFNCPLCRKRTQLPLGGVKKLPDNFLVSSLNEVVGRQRPSKFTFCDICKLVNRKHREATSKCLDCNKLLCKACIELHRETKVTRDHSLFDCEIEKDIECKAHQGEVVRFYCEPCETCICILCTFNEHRNHEITQFSEAVSKYKEGIQNLLKSCRTKTDVARSQVDLLKKCENIIKTSEQRIHDVAIQFLADIRSREKLLIDELHSIYGTEVMDVINRKEEIKTNFDSLNSTCNLTELVLQGKDIELLLLKKQVRDKLCGLTDVTLLDLPKSIKKTVTFIPGTVDLGSLEAFDSHTKIRPGLTTQFSLPTTKSQNHTNIYIRTMETQTDFQSQRQISVLSKYIQTLSIYDIVDRQPGEENNRNLKERPIKYSIGVGTHGLHVNDKAVSTQANGNCELSRDKTNDSIPQNGAYEPSNGISYKAPMSPKDSVTSVNRRLRRRRDRISHETEEYLPPSSFVE